MKVLFVNPGGDAAGGAERSLALLIAGLVERGHDALVATLLPGSAAASFAGAGATIVANGIAHGMAGMPRHGAADGRRALPLGRDIAATVRELSAIASAHRPDVVHTNGLRAHALTPYLGRRQRVVWSLRERPPGAPLRWLLRRATHGSVAIIAPSLFAAELATGCRRPVYVIANPVESGMPAGRAGCRAALGFTEERPIVAVVAHLHPTKGHHIAIEAWARLARPRPLLLLVGGDLYGEASSHYRAALRREVARAGLDDDVRLAGVVRDMPALYGSCDAVVHPALHPEGFGRSVAEAQRAGVPVVATALGGVRELITDGVSGLLIPAADPHALATAVSRVLGDLGLAERLRAGGVAAGRRYEPALHARAVEAVYQVVAS